MRGPRQVRRAAAPGTWAAEASAAGARPAGARARDRPLGVGPVLVPVALICLIGLVLGGLAYGLTRKLIEDEAVRDVGVAADGRLYALQGRFDRQEERARRMLEKLRADCGGPVDTDGACVEEDLRRYLSTEGALGISVRQSGAAPVTVGPDPPSAAPLESPGSPGRRVRFEAPEGETRSYTLAVEDVHGALAIRYPTDRFVDSLFEHREELGVSGETFLTDDRGFFVTPGRYPSESGSSHPIHAGPMQRCLSGRDGRAIEADYRGVRVIHGFRHVPATGGCIMAHFDHAEAVAPAIRLGRVLGAIAFAFVLLAGVWTVVFWRRYAKPLRQLTLRVQALGAGDFSPGTPARGPAEVRSFADALSASARALHETQIRLELAVRARDEFITLASHELKTPLTVLHLQLAAARRVLAAADADPTGPGRARHALERCELQLQRLRRLVRQMLYATELESGCVELNPEPFDLALLVRDVVKESTDEIERAGCAVELVGAASVEGSWDRFLVGQVFVNLLSNALKYGERRPVTVRVDASEKTAILEVRDRGNGIPPEDHARIFGRFERAAPAEHYPGLGLGLSIVGEIVAAHGGTIRLESARGSGATFVVELPRYVAARAAGPPHRVRGAPVHPAPGGRSPDSRAPSAQRSAHGTGPHD